MDPIFDLITLAVVTEPQLCAEILDTLVKIGPKIEAVKVPVETHDANHLWRWQLRQLSARRDDIDLAIGALERLLARETAAEARAKRKGVLLVLPRHRRVHSGAMSIHPPRPAIVPKNREEAQAAVAAATQECRYVAIRPANHTLLSASLGILLNELSPAKPDLSSTELHRGLAQGHEAYVNAELDKALGKAHTAWPQECRFEVIGTDSYKARTASDQSVPADTDGFFHAARVFGGFDTEPNSEPEKEDPNRRDPKTDVDDLALRMTDRAEQQEREHRSDSGSGWNDPAGELGERGERVESNQTPAGIDASDKTNAERSDVTQTRDTLNEDEDDRVRNHLTS